MERERPEGGIQENPKEKLEESLTVADLRAVLVEFDKERPALVEARRNPQVAVLRMLVEAAELAKFLEYKSSYEEITEEEKEKIAWELADVVIWALLISGDLGIDLAEAVIAKNKINAKNYPPEHFGEGADFASNHRLIRRGGWEENLT